MLTWKEVVDRAQKGNPAPPSRVVRDDAEWRAQLTPEQYAVTRQHGTERAFSSEMCSRFEPGRYGCVGCGTLLFDGTTKFESAAHLRAEGAFGAVLTGHGVLLGRQLRPPFGVVTNHA